MKKLYLVEFTETVVQDGVIRPVLPWDGLAANVHCVYPRAEGGRYQESHVMAAVEAEAKVHAEIARAIMERKGLPVGDAVAVKRVAGMVKGAMYRRAGRMDDRPLTGSA